MKRKDIKALHEMDIASLNEKLVALTMQYAKAKLEKKVGKLSNRRLVSTLSDDVARVKTVLHSKEMGSKV